MAALYFHELRYDPEDVAWAERDRFLLSTGHYSIALWAALAEAGIIPVDELVTYGADDSRLEMSTLDTTPGVELIGGSLGHGLGQAVGQALGLRLQKSVARVFVELSDGEMQEGSTWEAAMSASHFGLDGLVALVDCNGIQADGPVVLDMEPVADKWRAFGWDVTEIDGNDMNAIVGALMLARAENGKPKAIILRTLARQGRGAHRERARNRISSASTSGNGTASSPSSSRAREPHDERAGQNPRHGAGRGRRGGRPTVDAPFGRALAKLGQKRPEIVGLTADLGKYTDILPFRDAFPERFFNVGMAEQNLVAVAAGLARTGLVPFATTYGVFATRRAFDFVAIACAHSNLNVKIVAGLPGLTTGYGGTHQAIEDLALMRMIPGLTIIDPCDATEIEAATAAIADHPGPVYMRLLRGAVPVVLDRSYRFEIGKATAPARRQGCRHRLHRLHDRARARCCRRRWRSGASPSPSCTFRRSSRSTPRPSRLSLPASTMSSLRKTMLSSADSRASSSRRCSMPASASKVDADRPARPLHRMRGRADAAGADTA